MSAPRNPLLDFLSKAVIGIFATIIVSVVLMALVQAFMANPYAGIGGVAFILLVVAVVWAIIWRANNVP